MTEPTNEETRCEAVVVKVLEDASGRVFSQSSRRCNNEPKFEVTRTFTGVAQLLCGVHARVYRVGKKATLAEVRPLLEEASA